MLVAPGRPKAAPWTINELDPRHHWNPTFNDLTLEHQEHELFEKKYLPFDPYGRSILIKWDEIRGKFTQIAPHEPGWADPVVNSIRQDAAPWQQRHVQAARRLRDNRGGAIDDGAEKVDEYERKAEAAEEGREEQKRDEVAAAAGGFTAANR